MKRIFAFCTLFFVVCNAFADSLQMDVNVSSSKSSFVSTIADDDFYYLVSLTEKGIRVPSFISAKTGDWYVGEIRESGLLRFIGSPDEKMFDYGGTKAFQKVTNPAIKPKYSGFARSFKNYNFAFFYPEGMYMDVSNEKVYSALLYLHYPNTAPDEYMPQWNETGQSGTNLYGIIGYCDKYNGRIIDVKASSYEQFLYRQKYGLTGSLGWNIEVDSNPIDIEGFVRISDNDSNLPVYIWGYCLHSEGVKLKYERQNYDKAVFGGMARKKVAEFDTSLDFDNFILDISHISTAEPDGGKVSTSLFSLDWDLPSAEIGAEVGLNRVRGSKLSVNKIKLELSANNMKFCINGTKLSLLIASDVDFVLFDNVLKTRISVNQDRELNINIRVQFY